MKKALTIGAGLLIAGLLVAAGVRPAEPRYTSTLIYWQPVPHATTLSERAEGVVWIEVVVIQMRNGRAVETRGWKQLNPSNNTSGFINLREPAQQ